MGLGNIFHKIEEALTGHNDAEQPQEVDQNESPAYDEEQGIKPASEDPYGDPADKQ